MLKPPSPPGSLAKGPRGPVTAQEMAQEMARPNAAHKTGPHKTGMTREKAEALALQGLTFLAGDADRLTRFLTSTGIDPGDLRDWDANPGVQGAVLDHLLSDESLLLVFAAEAGVGPEEVWPAQAVLAGG